MRKHIKFFKQYLNFSISKVLVMSILPTKLQKIFVWKNRRLPVEIHSSS